MGDGEGRARGKGSKVATQNTISSVQSPKFKFKGDRILYRGKLMFTETGSSKKPPPNTNQTSGPRKVSALLGQ